MDIEAITSATSLREIISNANVIDPRQPSQNSPFIDAVNQLNNSVVEADEKVQSYILDGNVDVQEVMLAMEQAKIMMELAVQVRNKTIEAAQQLLRMQI